MTALHRQGWHGQATNGGSGWQVGNVGWGKASPNTSQPAPTSTFLTQAAQSFTLSPGSLSAILFVWTLVFHVYGIDGDPHPHP